MPVHVFEICEEANISDAVDNIIIQKLFPILFQGIFNHKYKTSNKMKNDFISFCKFTSCEFILFIKTILFYYLYLYFILFIKDCLNKLICNYLRIKSK